MIRDLEFEREADLSIQSTRQMKRIWMGIAVLLGVTCLAGMRPVMAAEELLAKAGVRGGLVVAIEGDADRLAGLCAGDGFMVHGLSAEPDTVEKLRAELQARGVYGPVSVERWDGRELPYIDNLVSMVVVENASSAPMEEVMRVLSPGGVLCLRTEGGWEMREKPRPEEMDDWTHYLYDSTNNPVSKDTLVQPPDRLQWECGPRWLRSHSWNPGFNALVSDAGRIFYIKDQGPVGVLSHDFEEKWALVARDAFNGVRLWQQRLEGFGPDYWADTGPTIWGVDNNWGAPLELNRRVVTDGERVYATLSYRGPLSVLDAATGQVLRTYDHVSDVDEVLLAPTGTLVLRVRDIPVRSAEDGTQDARKFLNMVMESGPEQIVAMDKETGEVLWRSEARRVAPESLVADMQRVAYFNFEEVVCLDLATGGELWRTPCERIGRTQDEFKKLGARAYSGTVIFYEGNAYFNAGDGVRCLSGKTGEVLWKGGPGATWGFASVASYMIADGALWTQGGRGGLDPTTGAQVRRVDIGNMLNRGHHIRCYRGKATERYLIASRRGAEFLDLRGNNHAAPDWLRGACSYGVMPANGLLYAPPDPCSCYPGVKVPGFTAVYGRGEPGAGVESPSAPSARLVRGPAFGETGDVAGPGAADWPTYRHDAARSGEASTAVAPELETSWSAQLGGELTPPVIAAGRVFVARKNAHQVVCLSEEDGRELWRFTAGGPVDSPPTVCRGLVLFGCADGRVYALRESDGELVWRFRVAPQERRLVSYGSVESVWPAHGSVLVLDGVVYATAGRSSYLDGGVDLYGLDAATGKMLHHAHVEGPSPQLEELRKGLKTVGNQQKLAQVLAQAREQGFTEFTVGNDMPGARTDVLVSDHGKIYLFQKVFDLTLNELPAPKIDPFGARPMEPHLISNNGFLDDSLDERKWWIYSDQWPGWHFGTQGAKQGRLLVFNEEKTYAAHTWPGNPGRFGYYSPGDHSLLVADSNANQPRPQGVIQDEVKSWTMGPLGRSAPPLWQTKVPMIIDALTLARKGGATEKVVLVAGTLDPADPDDLLAPFEGRTGGLLWAVSARDGAKLAELDLEAPPVFDGMAAADGRLFVSLSAGQVICLDKPNAD